MNKPNKQKISGYVMAVVGFVMILWNAINYIFNLNMTHAAFAIMGIVFVVIGMMTVKKSK